MFWGKFLVLILAMANLWIGAAVPDIFAQSAGGTIAGVIKDQQGAVVPAAKVLLVNTGTGVVRTTITNEKGAYTAPNLPPGVYEVSAEAEGFNTVTRRDVAIKVGAELVMDLTMVVGGVAETVEVHEDGITVDLITSTVQKNVGGETIRELPLNGRSWSDLATLQPGIASIGKGGGGGKGGNGVKLTVA